MEIPQKIRTTMWSNNSTRYISKEDEGRISGDMCLLMLLQHSLQQQWDDRQPRCPSADEWIRNQWTSELAQSCPTLCDPMDCSLPGSSIHGIFQARVLEWVAISFSRGSSWPRDQTQVYRIAGRCLTVWAAREVFSFVYMCVCVCEYYSAIRKEILPIVTT